MQPHLESCQLLLLLWGCVGALRQGQLWWQLSLIVADDALARRLLLLLLHVSLWQQHSTAAQQPKGEY
jgi:hypothetical protein